MSDLPREAIVAAASIHAARRFCRDVIEGTYQRRDGEVAKEMLEAAAPAIRAAERERIYAELGNDHHVIFTEDGWTIEHSVECRLSGHMHDECPYWDALLKAGVTDEPDPQMLGRWLIEIDSAGLPSLTRASPVGPS